MAATTNATAVFDEIRTKHKMKNDAELARRLEVAQSAISAMRKKSIPLGKAMQGRITERKLLSARKLKELLES
ncbi:MAG: hypothetical protein V4641_16310 [Pseudomonadota bacterium]